MGLSFWLVDSRTSSKLGPILELMSQLRRDVAGSSDRFELHATLLAGVKEDQGWDAAKAWSAAMAAVREWRDRPAEKGEDRSEAAKIPCRFKDVVTRGFFFQCILIALDAPESLWQLNASMRSVFSLESQPAYFPHLSLLYANLTAEQAKAEIDSLRSRGVVKPVGAVGSGAGGQSSAANVEVKGVGAVDLDELQLWDTNGPVGEWRCLHRARLADL